MNNTKYIEERVDRFVEVECATAPNAFIATRIMAAIANSRSSVVPVAPVWRMAIAGFVLALAVFAGVAAGSLYDTGTADNKVVSVNDDTMEHFEFYAGADE
jgi:hypothetical protein